MEQLFGIFMVLAIAVVIIMFVTFRKENQNCEFDERQELARGKAFKVAYIILLSYLMISEFFSGMMERNWCDSLSNIIIGISISITAFCIICIIKDAYIELNQNAMKKVIIVGSIGILNLLLGIFSLMKSDDLATGKAIFDIPVNLPLGVALIITAITLLAKNNLNKQEVE